MPPGKGKVMLRCSVRAELYDQLARESKQHAADLGAVIEGYVEQARQQGAAVESIVVRRIETLLQGQEQILRVLEALVTAMEGSRQSRAPTEGEEGSLPIASYAQMYGTTEAPETPSSPQAEPEVTQTPVKRPWRPW